MKTTPYVLVTAFLFAVMAFVHLIRLLQGWPVMLGTTVIPLWASVVAILLGVAIAVWGFSLMRKLDR